MSLITDSTRAMHIQTIDDFEDNEIAEYGGDTASFAVAGNQVQSGTYSLEGTPSGNGISSTSGLPHYLQQGETARVWVRGGSDSVPMVAFATQTETGFMPDGYTVQIDYYDSDNNIKVWSGGTNSILSANTTFSPAGGSWYELEIGWGTDGSITYACYDATNTQQFTISATDTTYTSGGIGFGVAQGSGGGITQYFDNFRVI